MVEKYVPRHYKIWEIDARFHCSLVGTCLTLNDLHWLCRRAGLRFQTPFTDYDLHHVFVDLAGTDSHAARLMQRRLDGRHRAGLRRFAALREESAMAAQWEAAKAEGGIAGAYWALMSHPHVTETLRDRVAGEVHMLSHLAGASRRRELADLKALQERQREQDRRLRATLRTANERLSIIQALNRRLADAHDAEAALPELRARIHELEQGKELHRERRRGEDLAATLAHARLEGERHAQRAGQWAERCRRVQRSLHRTRQELETTLAERDSLERTVRHLTTACRQDCTPDCPRFDLCRRRILYLGGRPTLGGHLRRLVEEANGEFLHHDGGREEADSALAALLPRADAVLCPVDCISHSAMQRARRICKQQAKPFLALRNASLSAFVRGLHEVANGLQEPARP